jgi:RND family efflux transporter MFP subunit
MNLKKTLIICFIILLVGSVVTLTIFNTEPTASRSGASIETAMLVDIVRVERDSYTPTIRATGTVEPSQDITLSPRVGGEITDLSDNFTPGGYVEKGEVLLQIDPSDYQNTLQQRESELRRAEADLTIEMGQQNIAEQDYALLDDSLTEESKALVLREPQLNTARAMVESARAAVEQAELELERTTIKAPFNAYILSRNANIGSQVAPGDDLSRLVGLETYWVTATIPVSSLRWISVPGGPENGSEVSIRNRTAWNENEFRTGQIYRLIGALEDQTRMARLLITIPDPLSYQSENSDSPPLMIGSFVEARIQADELNDVIRLNRDYIRQNDTVWVMEDSTLEIRDVGILFRDSEYAYITNGLEHGDQVVTTNLSTVVEGSRLRLDGSETIETGTPSSQ